MADMVEMVSDGEVRTAGVSPKLRKRVVPSAVDSEIENQHKQQELQAIYKLYWQVREDTTTWRKAKDKAIKFYHGNQYDPDTKELIEEENDMLAVVINTVRPYIKLRVAMMTSQKASGTLYGYHRDDNDAATALNDLLSFIRYESKFDNKIIKKACLHQQREGVSYFIIHVDKNADYGRGEIRISCENYKNVFVDKNVEEFDDAPFVIHTRLYNRKTFVEKHPDIRFSEKELDNLEMADDSIYWDGKAQKKDDSDVKIVGFESNSSYVPNYIRVYDFYEKRTVKLRVLESITGKIYPLEGGRDVTLQEQELIDTGDLHFNEYLVNRITVTKACGNCNYMRELRETIVLPISKYPIRPIINEDTGNMIPNGEVDYIDGLQELKNKAASVLLYNAAISSSLRFLGDSNTVVDETARAAIENTITVPGSISWMDRDAQGRWPIDMIKPEPINQAFALLVKMWDDSMQSAMGTFAFRAGDTSKAPETATLGLSMAEWSNDAIRDPLTNLEIAIEETFDIILELIPSVYSKRKVIDITTDNNSSMKRVVINEPQIEIETGRIIDTLNDVTEIHARYRVKVGSTLPTNSMAKLALLKELVGINPAFLPELIDHLPGMRDGDKEALKEKVDVVPKMKGQIEQLSNVVKQLQSDLKALNKKNIEAAKKLLEKEYEIKLVKELKCKTQNRDTSQEK